MSKKMNTSKSDGLIFDFYKQILGEPDSESDVYLGFGLFFASIAFAMIGLVLFIWAGMYDRAADGYWLRRQPAFMLGMLSIPLSLLSIVILLPIEKRGQYAATSGVVICTLSVLLFGIYYPNYWNVQGTDFSVHITGLYAIGMTIVTASMAASLIAHQLNVVSSGNTVIETIVQGDITNTEKEKEFYSDEEIQRDIDEAMENTEITWGGVEKTETTRLDFTPDHEFDDVEIDIEAKKTRVNGGVDAQVNGLRNLKGGSEKKPNVKSTSSNVDSQTEKLKKLRQKQNESVEKQTISRENNSRNPIRDRIQSFIKSD